MKFKFVLLIILSISSNLSLAGDSSGPARLKTVFEDTNLTYLGRLFERSPVEYIGCVAKGPTPEHEAGVLCAKASRSIVNCARPQANELHCGGAAVNYYGFGCMEREGFSNLLELENNYKLTKNQKNTLKSLGAKICLMPGTIMVYTGRCETLHSNRPNTRDECNDILKQKFGNDWFEDIVQKRIKAYMTPKYGSLSLKEAQTRALDFRSDRLGHMDVVAFDGSMTGAIDTSMLKLYSYSVTTVPSHLDSSGRPHGNRFLKGCFLPKADVLGILEVL